MSKQFKNKLIVIMSFRILAWDHRILLYLAHIPPDYLLPSHINLSQMYHPAIANHHHNWYKIQFGLQLTWNILSLRSYGLWSLTCWPIDKIEGCYPPRLHLELSAAFGELWFKDFFLELSFSSVGVEDWEGI